MWACGCKAWGVRNRRAEDQRESQQYRAEPYRRASHIRPKPDHYTSAGSDCIDDGRERSLIVYGVIEPSLGTFRIGGLLLILDSLTAQWNQSFRPVLSEHTGQSFRWEWSALVDQFGISLFCMTESKRWGPNFTSSLYDGNKVAGDNNDLSQHSLASMKVTL